MTLVVPDLLDYLGLAVESPEVHLGRVTLIVTLTNGLVDDVVGSAPDSAVIQAVRLEVARRAYENPRGLESQTESTGPFSKTWRVATAARSGVYLTDQERADLLGDISPTPITSWSGSLPYSRR